MIALIDHYDSFSNMLADYIRRLGSDVMLFKTDNLQQFKKYNDDVSHIIFGSGPGHPDDEDLQASLKLFKQFENKKPILGLCLGHQLIAQQYGATVAKAKHIMHGRLSVITHNEDQIFDKIPHEFSVTRYHSFLVNNITASAQIKVLATTDSGEIMAFRHKIKPIWGIQFHPEAAKTEYGLKLLENFLTS